MREIRIGSLAINPLDLFNIIQGIIALIVLLVWASLVVRGMPVPSEVNNFVWFVLGFFFSGVATNIIVRMR